MKFRQSENARATLNAISFLGPWLIGFLSLVLFPFLATLYWSFCRFDMLGTPQFVGLENYERMTNELVSGGTFATACWNTFYYAAISVPLSIGLGVGLAVILSWKVRFQSIYRTLIFVPSIIPVVASATLWVWLLDPQDGMVNHMIEQVGIEQQNWFASPNEAISVESAQAIFPSDKQNVVMDDGVVAARDVYRPFGSKDGLVLMTIWGVGNFMLIYLAAIGDIPQTLYEAAALDGAGPTRRFFHVTLPMLSPVIFFNLVMGLIQSVQAFTQIYVVSEGTGGPAESTLMLSLHLFLSAFQDLEMGYTSAMAWVLFVLLALATLLLFRSSRHWVHYRGAVR